jgi:hypothetical protein
MALDLQKHETQSMLSVVIAVLGILLALAAAGIMLQRFDWADFALYHKANSARFLAILGAGGTAFGLGVIGFFMGLNGAGQKRNKREGLAWLGFFLNAALITVALCVLIVFWLTRIEI